MPGRLSSILFGLVMTFTAVEANPAARVSFIDGCNGSATGVTDSNGIARLRVELSGLSENDPLMLKIRVFPADQLNIANRKVKEKVFKRTWRKVRTKSIVLTKVMILSEDVKIWAAQVTWFQSPRSLSSGAQSAAIYSVRGRKRSFFEVRGRPVCSWETPLTISSPYNYNESSGSMTLSREMEIESLADNERGFDFGFMPDVAVDTPSAVGTVDPTPMIKNPLTMSSSPYIPYLSDNFGWLFGGWQSLKNTTASSSVIRTWNLAPRQGGYFGHRMSFRRYPVIEYRLKKAKRCEQWKQVRTGYLDTGSAITSFVSVPLDISGDAAASAAFMEKMQPSVNTCSEMKLNDGAAMYQVPDTASLSFDQIMFFYPEQ